METAPTTNIDYAGAFSSCRQLKTYHTFLTKKSLLYNYF
ncbi:hypothetical protein D1AOALGA4SA_11176 [Olavius algarvensis Delta 1 endosymbiont]|nr:hypothetical protein D1AOALGA4SA_11176 [Olavius algarvensis Delta 1 endosymbiont]